MRDNVKLIGIGGTGENIIDKMILRGFDPDDCMIIQGTSEYFGESSARIKIALDNKENPADKYCYNEDDPVWGSRMILDQSETFLKAFDSIDMVVIIIGVDDGAGRGSSASIAMLGKMNAMVVISILLKPIGNVSASNQIFPGLDAIIENSDTTIMISRNQLKQLLPFNTTARFVDFLPAGDEIVSAVISEIITGNNENWCNIPLNAFISNGIGYIGIGNGPTVQTGMNRALSCPLLEYSSLERATRILAYFSIRHATEREDVRRALTRLQDNVNKSAEILTTVCIDENAEFCGVILLAARLS